MNLQEQAQAFAKSKWNIGGRDPLIYKALEDAYISGATSSTDDKLISFVEWCSFNFKRVTGTQDVWEATTGYAKPGHTGIPFTTKEILEQFNKIQNDET